MAKNGTIPRESYLFFRGDSIDLVWSGLTPGIEHELFFPAGNGVIIASATVQLAQAPGIETFFFATRGGVRGRGTGFRGSWRRAARLLAAGPQPIAATVR